MTGKREHTDGVLWVVGDDESAAGVPIIEIGSGVLPSPSFKSICEVQCTMTDLDEFVLTAEDRANARRLVAAWGACQGIETETLEGFGGGLKDAFDVAQADKARADEAEALLRDCEEYFDQRADAEYFPDSPAPHPNEEMKLLTGIRAFINKESCK